MPTNEERKEVAKKLRDKYKERNKPLFFEPQDMGIQAFNYLKDLQSCLPDGDSTFIVIADLIEPEPEQTFDEWLKDVKETCFANMEGCGEPEWSLFSTINDAIGLYLSGKSGYGCRMIDYDKEDFCKLAEKENDGSCVGYARSEIDDEPCDFCKECEKLSLNISEKRWYSDAD